MERSRNARYQSGTLKPRMRAARRAARVLPLAMAMLPLAMPMAATEQHEQQTSDAALHQGQQLLFSGSFPGSSMASHFRAIEPETSQTQSTSFLHRCSAASE